MGMNYSKLFEPTLIASTSSAAPDTILTVPSGSATNLLKGGIVRLTNTSASAVDVTLCSVPSGGSSSDTNKFFPTKSVPAKDFVDIQLPFMKAGDFLQAYAATTNVVNIQMIAGAVYSA